MSIEVEKGDDDLFKVFLYEGLAKTQQFCLFENHVHYFLLHNKCVRIQDRRCLPYSTLVTHASWVKLWVSWLLLLLLTELSPMPGCQVLLANPV